MKKIILIPLLILLTFILFHQCTEDSIIVPSSPEINFEKIINEFNSGKLDFEKGTLTTGKLIINNKTEQKFITVITNEQDEEHQAFFYQTEDIGIEKSVIKNGTLLYLKEQIIVIDNDTKLFYLIQQKKAKLNVHLSEVSFKQTISTFGIGKGKATLKNISAKSGGDDPEPILATGCKCIKNSYTTNCDSGGKGSTSCSCCDCSVSCGEGYYACCN